MDRKFTLKWACRFLLHGVLLVSCLFISTSLNAEYFGVQNGRIARFSDQPNVSVEAGYTFGDFASVDYKQLGVRLNYLLSPDVMVFGGIGQSDINRNEETSYGLGIYYSISDYISWSNEIALKLSYHQADFKSAIGGIYPTYLCLGAPLTVNPNSTDLEYNPNACQWLYIPISVNTEGKINNIVLELLMSGSLTEKFAGLTTNWYMSGGLHTLGGDIEGDQEFGIGGGLVFPNNDVEFYVGFEYVDESTIGFGLRYSVQ